MRRNELRRVPLAEGRKYGYDLWSNGTVTRTNLKTYEEQTLTPRLYRGRAVVTILKRSVAVKSLVARHFLKGYRKGDCVETVDGNPMNCHPGNLRPYSLAENGRRRGVKVRANGVEYESIRACAKALFVCNRTVYDYMQGNLGRSVLDGVEIERVRGGCREA